MNEKAVSKSIVGIMVLLVMLGFASTSSAQKVPASVKAQIEQDIDCIGDGWGVSSVRIGPTKRGYVAQCMSCCDAFVYEAAGKNVNRILKGAIGRAGDVSFSKKARRGYFDITFQEHGANTIYFETFQWNGSSFVRSSCEELEFGESGKVIGRNNQCRYREEVK